MKGFMYGIAGAFALLALVVAVAGLSNITLIGSICGAVLFGALGKVTA